MTISIYVHIPFCIRKCPYCDFYSIEKKSDEIPYKEYLSNILRQFDDQTITQHPSPISIYFGGGTPSLMPASFFGNLIDACARRSNLCAPEITCEVNPGTVEMNWFKDILSAGVNRVSIGVQSFDDQMLQKLGRIHTSEEAQVAIASAQDAGFKNVSIDLMNGLPDQRVDDLIDDLRQAMTFQPQHISVYQLTPPKGSLYHLPPEDKLVEMLKVTKRILERGGWHHYEISNFAKKDFESKHNMNYWNYGEYLGLGVGASSFFLNSPPCQGGGGGGEGDYFATRTTTKPNLQNYLNGIFEYDTDDITKRQAMGEFCFLGMRKIEGADLKRFERLFETKFTDVFTEVIQRLREDGLIELTPTHLKLTEKGLLFSNQVFAEFV
ncbi:MAG: radical SAM family heme chaperone HemW [Pseudomonadota bacterium]